MTEIARFFDLTSYSEADFARIISRLATTGVIAGRSNNLAITNGAGQVTVDTGEAFVEGFWYQNTAAKVLAIASNASATARIDRIVLALDRAANTLVAQVHQGVVGGGAPALTQVDGGNWEHEIAQVSVASGVQTLTDLRSYVRNYRQPIQRLSYTANTDLLSALATAANTNYDVLANQNFTLESAASGVSIDVRAGITMSQNAVGQYAIGKLVIDGADYAILGQQITQVANQFVNPIGSSHLWLPPGTLTTGVHTVRITIRGAAAGTASLRASTQSTWEFLQIQIVEFPP